MGRGRGKRLTFKGVNLLTDEMYIGVVCDAETRELNRRETARMVMISTQVSELELDDFQGKVTQTVVLSNMSWQTYKALLADMGSHRAVRT